jgi:hypothetical protein
MSFLKKLYVLFLFQLIMVKSYPQAFNRYKFEEPWSFAISSGGTQYFGDLYSFWKYRDQPQINPTVNFSLRKTLGTSLKARFDIGYYQISGNDQYASPKSDRSPRNLHFRARNFESSLLGEIYLRPIKKYHIDRDFINIYAIAGIGITTNKPMAVLDQQWVNLRPLQIENQYYNKLAITYPMGIGIKYKLNVYTDLQFEVIYKWTNTDYLDDISAYDVKNSYLEAIEQFEENPNRLRLLIRNPEYLLSNGQPDINKILASKGRIRRATGLDVRKDGYLSLNVGLEIYLSEDVWENWIFRNRRTKNYYRFW